MNKIESMRDFWSTIPTDIGCVGVVGAGAMGGGIAAQFANAGVNVILLDVPGEGAEPDAPAREGVARQIKTRGFMGTTGPHRVQTGNVRDDLHLLAQADWIIEAIVERASVKRELYARIDTVRKPGSIVSSNTSTLLHAALVEGMSEDFRRSFVITHFFNPPRMMPLLEVVATAEAEQGLAQRVQDGARALLGKTVIHCRDTPGFVANRIGCFWMASAAMLAQEQGMSIEQADLVHQGLGIPKTGVFGLFDLIGIDLVPTVWRSLVDGLPENDRFRRYDIAATPLFQALVEQGRFGRKAGAGFFRKDESGLQASDLDKTEWRPAARLSLSDLPGEGRDMGALFADDGPFGRYARAILAEVVGYAATHAPDIAADASEIDVAMELGFAWRDGPFKLADRWGLEALSTELRAREMAVPDMLAVAVERGGFYKDGRFVAGGATASPQSVALSAAHLRCEGLTIRHNDSASLLDMGDGVGLLEIHTKMNSLHPQTLDMIEETLLLLGSELQALVIGNDDARAFSAGADLSFIYSLIEGGRRDEMESYIDRGQALFLGLRYAPTPVVAAVHGFALGGGCELALHSDCIMAHAEARFGLPEARVGLIPAWGGCTTLRANLLAQGMSSEDASLQAARTIFGGGVCSSAEEALAAGILTPRDRLVMHRQDLLETARRRALALLEEGYVPPAPMPISPPTTLDLSVLAPDGSDFDRVILRGLSDVLSGGGPRSDSQNMAIERRVLFDLVECHQSTERMKHMLDTGKPLQN